MKKFLNDPVNFVDEMLEGIYRAHPQLTYVDNDKRCMVTANTKSGKVGIATGGGSGHLPLFLGYIGEGMIDGAAVGGVVGLSIDVQNRQRCFLLPVNHLQAIAFREAEQVRCGGIDDQCIGSGQPVTDKAGTERDTGQLANALPRTRLKPPRPLSRQAGQGHRRGTKGKGSGSCRAPSKG